MPADGLSRREMLSLTAGLGLGAIAGPALAAGRAQRVSALVPFMNSPFPYDGKIPQTNTEFLDVNDNGRMGHTSGRGGVYWLDPTYIDTRALVALPRGFDLKARPKIVVFFHGNGAILDRDVIKRQAVLDQLEASGLNAALVAPQFAVDALDSSAGWFWNKGAFASFVKEACGYLGQLAGKGTQRIFEGAPIILVGYSGGYDPEAFVLYNGDDANRIRGVVILDGLLAEVDKFAVWIAHHRKTSFFFSAYSQSSADGNAALQRVLQSAHINFDSSIPDKIGPGSISFQSAPDAVHNDFVTEAWTDWPLKDVLGRIAI